MKGLGILVNVLAVVVGGSVGSLFRGKMKVRYQRITVQSVGMIVMVLGGIGLIRGMFPFREDLFETTGTMLAVFALVVGTMLGEAMRVEDMFDSMGRFFRSLFEKSDLISTSSVKSTTAKQPAPATDGKKHRNFSELPIYNMTSPRSGHRFVDGFVYATLIVCANSMALTGTIAEVVENDHKTLLIKAVIDVVLIAALATVFGAGTALSALPLTVVEVTVLLLQNNAVAFMSEKLVGQLAIITSVIFIAVGFALAFGKKLRVCNILPANLVPVLYYFIIYLVSLSEKTE